MGANASKEGSVTPNSPQNAINEVDTQQKQQIPKGCPMHEENAGKEQERPTQPGEIPKGCPMHSENQVNNEQVPASQSGPVYNVYSQEINPDNKMPQNPNQQLAPGQQEALSTQRQKSTIPKGGENDTWTYPSEQMFYNALVRKGKADGVQEQDMKAVITIHNNMNERTWEKVKEWENLHQSEHDEGGPRLRRFTGRPYELSPKAKLKSYIGFGYPFDRHDWYVNRGDKEVRYVIDYYYNPNTNAAEDPLAPIWVDVRPALETPRDVFDRARLLPTRLKDAWQRGFWYSEGLDPNTMSTETHTALTMSTGGRKGIKQREIDEKMQKFHQVEEKCRPLLDKLENSNSDNERRQRMVALNYCMGQIVCPEDAKRFKKLVHEHGEEGTEGEAGGEEEKVYMQMTECVTEEMKKINLLHQSKQKSGGSHGEGSDELEAR
eukprot:gb/GECG01004121.1/.p1 GENE.gb/GECG01004121.1/~~gb/GECG01004121.1/.p1  ORF type:complete len:435 (+),score=77.65 gb/GECG01004121.1/:1-1305(+)